MRRLLGLMLLGATWAVLPCAAQSKPDASPAPCSVAPQPDPCGTTPKPANKSDAAKPDAAQKFPFPGEIPSPGPSIGSPNLSGAPDAPAGPAVPAAKKFPFPEDADKPNAEKPDASKPDAAGSGGSSSSSSSSSSDTSGLDADGNPTSPGLQDKGSEGAAALPGRHILHRVNPIGTKLLTPDEREGEDLDIAHFYVSTGDLPGAYLRSQDAVKTMPDDPEAHFLLAEVAAKLNKRDEAIAEYNACLKLDPVEKQAKEARKALARLKP